MPEVKKTTLGGSVPNILSETVGFTSCNLRRKKKRGKNANKSGA